MVPDLLKLWHAFLRSCVQVPFLLRCTNWWDRQDACHMELQYHTCPLVLPAELLETLVARVESPWASTDLSAGKVQLLPL